MPETAMRVLITQSAEDTAASVVALESRGHQVVAVPLVTAERAPPPKINLAGAQGFLVTSTEGARALADHVGVRTFPAFADSEVTTAALRRLGFKHVETAKDDAADLARLVERSLKPANGALIYACSTAAPVNLSAMLSNMGFAVRPLPLYTIKRVAPSPAAFHATLQNKSVDTALFLTPDEARAFVALVQREEMEPLVRALTAVAATPVVAAPLRALKLGGVIVPPVPDLNALFDALSEKLVDRVAEERAERERHAKELAEAETERQRIATENAARERAEKGRLAQEAAAGAEQERLAREQAEREKTERAAQERAEKERLAQAKAAAEKAERERRAAEKSVQDRIAREKAAAEKAEKERIARERAEKERAERAEKERVAAEKAAQQRAEKEPLAREQGARARIERERLAAERAERDHIAREKAASEKAGHERRAQEQTERDHVERERLASERAERDRIVREQIALAKSEQERGVLEQAEQARQERERLAAERAEQESVARAKAERERLIAEQAARNRIEGERLAAEKMERDRVAREKAAEEQAQRERLERERLAAEKTERNRIAREGAARAKAERQQAKAEKQLCAREEKAREKAQRVQDPPRLSLTTRLMTWFARPPAPDTAPPPPAIWDMAVDTTPPAGAAATIVVAQAASSVTMAPTLAVPEMIPEAPTLAQGDGPQTKETKDVSEHSPSMDTPTDGPDAVENAGDSKPVPRGGSRAARLLAEDAADLRAKDQRFKYLGHSEPEPEAVERQTERQSAAFAAPAQNRGGAGRLIGLFVVLVVMAGAVIGTASWWVPRVTHIMQSAPTASSEPDAATPVQADITALKARVAVLEQEAVNTVTPDALKAAKQELMQRLATLEGRKTGEDGDAVTSLGDSVSSQAKQLAAVSARLATLEAAIGNTARLEDLSKRLNMLEGRSAEAHSVLALSDRVTALETTARRTMVEQSANIALLMAVSQWREALLAGRPFALELQTVKALAARVSDVAVDDSGFATAATQGLPTLADLQRQFGPAAAAAMRASAMPEGTGAWYRRILDRMLAIVTVRRLDGDAAGTGTAAVLARAENRLDAGDLSAAVTEMDGLSGAAAAAAQAWQVQAKARVAAEHAASDAATKAVAAVAATGDKTPAAPSAATSNGP